jgi:hypothetical protein
MLKEKLHSWGEGVAVGHRERQNGQKINIFNEKKLFSALQFFKLLIQI